MQEVKNSPFLTINQNLKGKQAIHFFYPNFNIFEELPQLIGTGILEFDNDIPKRETVKCSCNVGLGGREKLNVKEAKKEKPAGPFYGIVP